MSRKLRIGQNIASVIAIMAMLSSSGMAHAAYLIPTSEVAHEINGSQVLVRTYETKEEISPEEEDSVNRFTKDGFDYELSSREHEVKEESESKSIRVPVSISSSTDGVEDTVKKLEAVYHYNEDGYEGDLFVDPQTIRTEVTATEEHGGTVTASRTYTLEYNDPALVPEAITENGATLKLANVTWTEGEYREDGSVPAYYTANATYSRTSRWEKPSEYTTTATYFGTVTKTTDALHIYTMTYLGTPTNALEKAVNMAFVRGGLLAAGAVLFILIVAKTVLYILSQFVKVRAQDDETGEYTTIQRVRLNSKAPAIEVDVLKAPGSRHFLFTMSEKAARRMKGKIILIHAGQETGSHQVGEPYGKEYSFTYDIT